MYISPDNPYLSDGGRQDQIELTFSDVPLITKEQSFVNERFKERKEKISNPSETDRTIKINYKVRNAAAKIIPFLKAITDKNIIVLSGAGEPVPAVFEVRTVEQVGMIDNVLHNVIATFELGNIKGRIVLGHDAMFSNFMLIWGNGIEHGTTCEEDCIEQFIDLITALQCDKS